MHALVERHRDLIDHGDGCSVFGTGDHDNGGDVLDRQVADLVDDVVPGGVGRAGAGSGTKCLAILMD